jgi:hypothetical protein
VYSVKIFPLTGAISTTSKPTTCFSAKTLLKKLTVSFHNNPLGSAVPTAGTMLGSKPSASTEI